MITMKKRFNIIIISIIIVLIICIIVVLNFNRKNNLKVIVFPKHYSMLYDEYPELEVSLYVSNDNTKYLDQSFIQDSIVYNKEDTYKVTVLEHNENAKTKINNKIYYEKKLKIKFNLNSSNEIHIKNANLKLEFSTNEMLNVVLGNISFYKNQFSEYINVHKVQGIVNDFGLYDSLAAVVLSISCDESCKITNITPMSSTVGINNKYVLTEVLTEYEHNINLKTILGQEFDSFKQTTESFKTINLNKNTKKDIMIPLYYIENEYVDSIGFLIEFYINEQKYVQIINPYKLYQSHKITYFLKEYKISRN